ncbi:hypothetical protein HDC93_007417 [Streptomyces sp. AK010]|nr:hypothetical protein [Streptomyces sp. AK010]
MRSRPMAVAAGMPLPMTSPTARAVRSPLREMMSYQSPPTSLKACAGRYRAAICRPGRRGEGRGSRLR